MSEPVTKADWVRLHRRISAEEQAALKKAYREVTDEYLQLFNHIAEQWELAPEVAPVKIEGAPPNEKANWAPPRMKIEFAHPCAGDKCMNNPCCEDPC